MVSEADPLKTRFFGLSELNLVAARIRGLGRLRMIGHL